MRDKEAASSTTKDCLFGSSCISLSFRMFQHQLESTINFSLPIWAKVRENGGGWGEDSIYPVTCTTVSLPGNAFSQLIKKIAAQLIDGTF